MSSKRFRATRQRCAGAVLAVCAVVLTSCTIQTQAEKEAEAARQHAIEVEQRDKPTSNIKDQATGVSPIEPVTVSVEHTKLSSVSMTNEEGKVVQAELSQDGKSWKTTEPLGYYRTYTIDATAENGHKLNRTFTTLSPDGQTGVYLSPLDNSTVGVGQTISFRFEAPIKDRHAAQNAIKITTNPPVEGAFYWLNNSELRWRPAEYWAPGTHVDVEANIYGIDFGNGVYGGGDNRMSFNIGDAIISTVDDATKTMTVTRNGEVLRTMPVSLGSNKWPTPNGTYIIGDRTPSIIMDSSTFGVAVDSPEGYRTDVKWATQMSWSGIYVHAAPWSLWAQGSQNVSHGCVNVSTENAQWFQQISQRGDIVRVVNTIGGTLSGYDGLGDWNIPWETWKAGNADETSSW